MDTNTTPINFRIKWTVWGPRGYWTGKCWCKDKVSATDFNELNRVLMDHVRVNHPDGWDPAKPVYIALGDLEQFKKYVDYKMRWRWGVTSFITVSALIALEVVWMIVRR